MNILAKLDRFGQFQKFVKSSVGVLFSPATPKKTIFARG